MGKSTRRTSQGATQRGRFGARYAAVALGNGLLLFAGDAARLMLVGSISPLRGLVTMVASALGMFCLLAACLPVEAPPTWRLYARGWPLAAVGAGALALFAVLVFLGSTYSALSAPHHRAYVSDAMAFSYVNARAVVAGHNPYTNDASFRAVVTAFPLAAPTPLRRGLFAGSEDYPLSTRFIEVEQQWLANPASDAGEFDPATLHSYPALAFLLYVPLVWAGVGNVLILNVLVCAALLAWLAWLAPVGQRGWAALALATAAVIPRHSLLVDSEVVCVALLLAAWHWRERRWVGAILLGLACAFKQYCWFFAPFFLLDALLRHGWREAARRGAIAAGAFLLPNLPFVLASPRAWLASLALPMRDPMFPSGIGAIALSQGHLLPYGPPPLYAALEGLALVGALWLFARYHVVLGEAALLLALLPLWFAFRSPPNYFAFAPWLAVYAACMIYRTTRTTSKDTKDAKGIVIARPAALAPRHPSHPS